MARAKKRTNSKLNVITSRPFMFYMVTSFGFGALVTFLALFNSQNGFSDFYNSKPIRGEMGFGNFVIRGSRYMNGKYTPFAYPWRLVDPSTVGNLIGQVTFVVHQVGQWFILYKVQSCKTELIQWGDDYQWWNWQMVYLNGFMSIFKLIHGHLFYDGLASFVPEGIAQGSVVMILVIAIVMAIPYRGIAFGYGKKSLSKSQLIPFIKKYHGYMMSFGTVLNFHYHPVEGTMGHLFGFVYQCMLMWQSTNFLHKSHRNKSWIFLLETWVFIHGSLTALIQPGIGWQIFSYGFMAMLLINQIFQTTFCQNKTVMITLYVLFFIWVYWGFNENKAYYRASFIPISEYVCVYFVLGFGKISESVITKLPFAAQKPAVVTCYLVVATALTVGLALTIAGNLRVYNDY